MNLKLLIPSFPQNRSVTPRLRIVQNHGLIEKVEAVDFIDRASGGFHVVEHNERLALGLQVGLRDDLDDVAIFREDLVQCDLQLVDFDSFFQVTNLDMPAVWLVSVHGAVWELDLSRRLAIGHT